MPLDDGDGGILIESSDTTSNTDSAPGTTSPERSSTSAEPSSDLRKLWLPPRNVRELASQVNLVATMVLNGDIPLKRARIYSALTRVASQAISAEVSKARFAKTLPELSFEEEERLVVGEE